MKSPGTILKLWNRIDKKHTEGKQPKELAKKGEEQKLNIRKGLTTLRTKGSGDLTDPSARRVFEAARDRVARLLRNYCRYLKAAKDEDKKVLPRHLKAVKQVTVLVQKLDPGDLDPSEEEVSLDSLEGVDVGALDRQLEGQEAEAEEPEAEEEGEASEPAEEGPDHAETYRGLMATLPGDLARLRAADRAAADRIQPLLDAAQKHAQGGDYAKACTFLGEAAKAVAGATGAAAARSAAPPVGKVAAAVLRLELQQVRLQAAQGVGELESALRKTDNPRAREVAALIRKLAAGFPTEMEGLLQRLDAAVKANDAGGAQKIRGEVQQAAKGWLGYLQANAEHIQGCESNPWGIKVRIAEPIRKSLTAILKTTQ
jgi:hypothetical protein